MNLFGAMDFKNVSLSHIKNIFGDRYTLMRTWEFVKVNLYQAGYLGSLRLWLGFYYHVIPADHEIYNWCQCHVRMQFEGVELSGLHDTHTKSWSGHAYIYIFKPMYWYKICMQV